MGLNAKTAGKNYAGGWLLGVWLLVIVGGVVVASWANYRFIQPQRFDANFAMGWYATRALIMEGQSPYSAEVRQAANQAFAAELTGKPALIFTAPLYALFLYFPFALSADFIWANTIWLTVLQGAGLLLVWIWMRLTQWEPPRWLKILLSFLGLLWLPTALAVGQGGTILLLFTLFSLAVLALQTGRDEVAGVLFIFAAVQLQILLLSLLLVLIWAFSQRRQHFLVWVLGAWAVLCVLSFFFIPNWILQNIWVIAPDFQYEFSGTLRSLLAAWFPGVGQQVSVGVAGLLLVLLAVEWWQAWRKPAAWLVWTLALTLVVSIWLNDRAWPQNVAVTLAGSILVGAYLEKRWQRAGRLLLLGLGGGLSAGIWASFWFAPDRSETLFFFVVPVVILLGLYWIRWWMARSVRLNLN